MNVAKIGPQKGTCIKCQKKIHFLLDLSLSHRSHACGRQIVQNPNKGPDFCIRCLRYMRIMELLSQSLGLQCGVPELGRLETVYMLVEMGMVCVVAVVVKNF